MKNTEYASVVARAKIDEAISEYLQKYGNIKLFIINKEGQTSEIVIESGSGIYTFKG